MKEFLRKHEDRIHNVLSCFDRMLFRGYLPMMSGCAMAQFLNLLKLDGDTLKPFLLKNSERVKSHAVAMAKKYQRRFEYLRTNIQKEERARELAKRDGIQEGLVCIFSIVENCRTFSLRFSAGSRFVRSSSRKCLHFYYYFIDRDFGLIHVRIQSRFTSTGMNGWPENSQPMISPTVNSTMYWFRSTTLHEPRDLRIVFSA
jgi:hypothetical protein